ncbi:unnamed protein product [Caenorhabditis bovis]|uniref:G-protein coupled receptors family 1 profile domain-containing protein n=1 Tax=Caenorhabditis bovis TaxID=2654633 RepID=A0A8S1EUV7_9PELO|nr:unnamed protein product [Caenorhabditis bovis]
MNSLKYVLVFDIWYKFYAIAGLTGQFLLLYLINRKSPATMDHLKYFLYNTSFVQIALILAVFSIQHRVHANATSVAILSTAPCTWIGPTACFTMYHALCLDAACCISSTVLFRYLVVRLNEFTVRKIAIIISSAHAILFLVLLLPFFDTWNFEKLRDETYSEHPAYNLKYYEPLFGFANNQSFQFLAATALLALVVYGIPFASGVMTRQVLVTIRYHQNMSDKTKKQAMTLIYGLICQTFLPFVAYIPIFSSYLYSQITGEEMLLSGHLILVMASMPALVDPIISFYFIVPYRQAIIERFCTKRNILQIDMFTVSSTSAVKP